MESTYSYKKEKQDAETRPDAQKEEYTVIINLLCSCIVAPSWDVYTDLVFAIQMIKDGNTLYGLSSVVPQILNIFFTYFAWRRWEQGSARRWSLLLVLIQCWPQFYAARII